MDDTRQGRLGLWVLLVAAGLFISSIGFVVAGARSSSGATPSTPVVETRPVASIKQIMNGIIAPASTVVYDVVSTTVTATGIEEKRPQSDAEWENVGASAAALVEAGNLMLMEGHAIDKQQWVALTREFMDAGMLMLKAAEAKDPDAVLTAGSTLNDTCDKCHERYQR